MPNEDDVIGGSFFPSLRRLDFAFSKSWTICRLAKNSVNEPIDDPIDDPDFALTPYLSSMHLSSVKILRISGRKLPYSFIEFLLPSGVDGSKATVFSDLESLTLEGFVTAGGLISWFICEHFALRSGNGQQPLKKARILVEGLAKNYVKDSRTFKLLKNKGLAVHFTVSNHFCRPPTNQGGAWTHLQL
ncbi:unnamed protein product [Cyclocybe aegerita]|uniref:Uncharacterized protein n=1 Tax=Cyclocybe aegerita TaxID=1973307 RepID=A0A8S0WSL9_CYCAE|nr:unnamed protein product [Cyclocybe aegerita]